MIYSDILFCIYFYYSGYGAMNVSAESEWVCWFTKFLLFLFSLLEKMVGVFNIIKSDNKERLKFEDKVALVKVLLDF